MRKKDRAGGITCPDFTLNYKAIVTKRYGSSKNIHMNWRNRIESLEIDPRTGSQFIYDKGGGGENIQWRKDSLSTKLESYL